MESASLQQGNSKCFTSNKSRRRIKEDMSPTQLLCVHGNRQIETNISITGHVQLELELVQEAAAVALFNVLAEADPGLKTHSEGKRAAHVLNAPSASTPLMGPVDWRSGLSPARGRGSLQWMHEKDVGQWKSKFAVRRRFPGKMLSTVHLPKAHFTFTVYLIPAPRTHTNTPSCESI